MSTTFADICDYAGHKLVEITPLHETKTYLYVSIDQCSKCKVKVKHSRYKYMTLEDEYI